MPDLATAIPTPTDGGTTYTFRIRRGIRYSNGALAAAGGLPARDRAIGDGLRTQRRRHRLLLLEHRGLRGVPEAPPRRCDLSNGIVADPASNTVTFHLTRPDPDFLAPARTPVRRRRPGGHAVQGSAAAAGDGPVHVRERRHEARRAARSQPALPRVVSRRPTRRLPGRDRLAVRRRCRARNGAPSSEGAPIVALDAGTRTKARTRSRPPPCSPRCGRATRASCTSIRPSRPSTCSSTRGCRRSTT